MPEAPRDFPAIVIAILERYCAQLEMPAPAGEIARLALQLKQLIDDRGLPPPLRPGERGEPGSMSEEECAPLVGRVVAGVDAPALREAARQLVKACFYPEFSVCRDSFREVTRDGTCRRQQWDRVRSRVSGSHCVDCPHWVALPPAEHAAYLAAEWRGDPRDFAARREVFLPEDFRALRLWLHKAARNHDVG